MKLAVASGKGGTGKTMVSASLVSIWPHPVVAVDLDVEEPNLHLFLNPRVNGSSRACMEVPEVDESRCTYCRKCAELCQFKAISVLGEVILTFPEMCHGCGGCLAVCPEGALAPGRRELGEISWGNVSEETEFLMGRLRVGEAMSPPLMRQVKARLEAMTAGGRVDAIIDAPPGVSCPAVNAVLDTDVILLVTEPTPFGLYDLKLAHDAFLPFAKPMGVVINRAGLGFRAVYEYCTNAHLPIWGEIPYDRAIAEAYSNGQLIAEAAPAVRPIFQTLVSRIRTAAGQAPAEEASHA